jgi:hypothetical protein
MKVILIWLPKLAAFRLYNGRRQKKTSFLQTELFSPAGRQCNDAARASLTKREVIPHNSEGPDGPLYESRRSLFKTDN